MLFRSTELLINNHVEEIKQVRRVEVEPAAEGGMSRAGGDSLDLTINEDPKALYRTLPFEFQFNCSTEALRNFLNALSQSDWFFAVRRITTVSQKQTGAARSVQFDTRFRDPRMQDSRMSGEANKPLERNVLTVTARIDLVEFAGKQGKAAK